MVNVAVIGIGNMGKNHVRVYSELKSASLVAISDLNKDGHAVAKKTGCRFYKDYNDMLAEEAIDAVSICVPTKLHKKVAMDCIREGTGVLIEKPIADTVENARDIIRAAEKAGVLLTVGHIERFNPAVQKLKSLMKQKKLGQITSIVARRVGAFPPQIKDANVFLDLAVHDIDIFNYLLETAPTKVYSRAGAALNGRREDHAVLIFNYGSATCFLQVNWITPIKLRQLSVTGTKGYAELNYITQDLVIYKSVYERTYDSFGDFVVKFGTPKELKVNLKKEEPLKAELRHFIDCVRGKARPLVTGADGLLALQLSIDAAKSYKADKATVMAYDRKKC